MSIFPFPCFYFSYNILPKNARNTGFRIISVAVAVAENGSPHYSNVHINLSPACPQSFYISKKLVFKLCKFPAVYPIK